MRDKRTRVGQRQTEICQDVDLTGTLTPRVVRWLLAAPASGIPSAEAPTVEALIEALDPEVRAAIDDVDRTLIALSLRRERLRFAHSWSESARCWGFP
jgi:hypothetical protein